MNKKILLGSVIAAAILVGVSFTSVVGFQSVKPGLKASPLFAVRTNRAIDEETQDFTCDYVGKGDKSILSIPNRNDKNDLFQNFIERIQLMNDETFNKFVNSVVYKHQYNKDFKDINVGEIIIALSQIREKQEINTIEDYKNPTIRFTYLCEFAPTLCWFPFCIVILVPFFIFDQIWIIISFFYPTCHPFYTYCGE